MIDIKITILDGSYHEVDSSDLAFQQAGSLAFADAVRKAQPVLLEPVMSLQVIAPEQFYGQVQGDLTRRRAVIQQATQRGKVRVINALAPLAEMFGYASDLRGSTQGRATYTMEPYEYRQVPEQISQKVLAKVY